MGRSEGEKGGQGEGGDARAEGAGGCGRSMGCESIVCGGGCVQVGCRSAGWDIVDVHVTEAGAGRKEHRICYSTFSVGNDAESKDFALRDQGIVLQNESCDVESWDFPRK